MLKSLETLLLRYSRPLLFLSTPVIFFVELVVALFRALLLRSVNVLLVAFRAHWMEARGDLLMEDYASSGDGLVLKRAIKLYEGALGLRPTGDNRRSVLLLDLGAALRRFCTEQLADAARLTQAIMLHREALELLPPGHLSRPRALDGLATILLASFEQFGSLGDVTEAIEALREAMVLYPYADRNRSFLLTNLAYALWVHFRQLGDMSVLAEAIDLDREALALRRPGDSSRCSSLSNLASALIARFEKQGDSPSLAEAIDLQREAAYTCPIGDPARPVFLGNLATALLVRFEQDGDCNLIAEAVELSRQALKLCPAGHPDRSMSLTSLANALMYRFNREGDVQAVAEAICLYRQALILRPLGHPERSVTMDSLAGALLARFKQDEDMEALTEALTLRRGASDLLPRGNLNRAASLNNLAITLMALFKQNGDLEALAEATNLHRQALELRPPGHSESVRAGSLDNLAIALRARFATQGDIEALEEAISLHREALRLFPPNHPEYDSALTCLANALSMSFELHGEPEKLEEAIALHRQALHRRPPEHPGYSILLNNLASALQLRHDQRNDALAEAITLNRQALDLRPPPNPSRALTLANLGNALRAQYLQAFTTEAFEEDLALAREGLNICPYGHPMRQRFLFAVAGCLLLPGTAQFDFDAGVCHIKEALKDECSPARERLGRMVSASGALEVAHRFVGRDNGSSGSRQMLRDEAVLHVYVSSVQLLSRVADFGLDHASRLRELAGVETLSRNAAVFAIGTRREGDAVEMLEEGRGVFWSQALRLHGSGLELLSMDDQRELQRLFQVLESGSHQETLMSPAQRDRKIEERRRLSKKAESLIANIRSRPGMERFLLPPAFSSLLQSLPSTGFVVMLIDSQHGHRALLMERSNTRAMSIELSSPAGGFLSKAVQASLPRDGAARPLFSLDAQTVRAFGISKSRMRIKNSKACEPLENTLAEIWTTIVKPVIVALRLQKLEGRARPRVWWCATGHLSFLPIHAAANVQDGISDRASHYFVSSYIPTLSALTKAHSQWRPIPRQQVTGILAACRNTPGQAPLENVEQEICAATDCFKQASTQLTYSSKPNTAVKELQEALDNSNAHILHLACHGVQAPDPLQSAFLLSDGKLTIEMLMQMRLPDAMLAFLSACQTARGSEMVPDQAVHLAASMLFCGFRSVVGTMWSMNDDDGPDVARWFYECLFARDEVYLDDIAHALDSAVAKLRENGVLASRWALFIHIGG